jgi:hypothetical protein
MQASASSIVKKKMLIANALTPIIETAAELIWSKY